MMLASLGFNFAGGAHFGFNVAADCTIESDFGDAVTDEADVLGVPRKGIELESTWLTCFGSKGFHVPLLFLLESGSFLLVLCSLGAIACVFLGIL